MTHRRNCIWAVVLVAAVLSGMACLEHQRRPQPDPRPVPAHRPDRPRPIRTPLFDRHRKDCPQCRGDIASEEGGPPPLCEQGFELWKDDMKASKGDPE